MGSNGRSGEGEKIENQKKKKYYHTIIPSSINSIVFDIILLKDDTEKRVLF